MKITALRLLAIGLWLLFCPMLLCAEMTRPLVCVSIAPQAYIVEQLAADYVDVIVLIPEHSDAESYEPTMTQIAALSQAALYLKVGHPKLYFETEIFNQIIEPANKPDRLVLSISTSHGAEIDTDDPHVWVSPDIMLRMIVATEVALARILPDKKNEFAAKAEELRERVAALDTELKSFFEDVKGKSFYVYHPAWGYFAKHYGLNEIAIEHEGHEPGPHKLGRILSDAKAKRVSVIFIQPGHADTSASMVAAELGAKLIEIDPLKKDWLANFREISRKIKEGLV